MIRKFTAANSAEGLLTVRQSLGPDALILSTKETADGLELLAVRASDLESLGQPAVAPPPAPPTPPDTVLAPAVEPEDSPPSASTQRALMGEIQSLRDWVQSQIPIATPAPYPLSLQRCQHRLVQCGLSMSMAQSVLEGLDAERLDSPDWLQWLVARLSALLPIQPPMPLLQKGGTFVVMGPTGVGKTTALAKMAARCVLQHGPKQVVLVSCDQFRIGAQAQLRIYADLLGIPMVEVNPQEPLGSTGSDALNKRVVLVDTAGVSPKELPLLQQTEALYRNAPRLHRLLVISATTDSQTLQGIFDMYKQALQLRLNRDFAGCILTKLDEAATLGPAIDRLIRHQLPLWFTSDGQRVPEDLAEPRPEHLSYALLHRHLPMMSPARTPWGERH